MPTETLCFGFGVFSCDFDLLSGFVSVIDCSVWVFFLGCFGYGFSFDIRTCYLLFCLVSSCFSGFWVLACCFCFELLFMS